MSLKVEVEVQVQDLPKVEKPIPVLANSIPLGGYKGQALVKKSNEHYDVEWKTIEGGTSGGSGYTEEELKALIKQETEHLQPTTDAKLETQSKDIVGAINELNSREDKVGVTEERVQEIVDENISGLQNEEDVLKIVENATKDLQGKESQELQTQSKTIVGAINELASREDKEGLSQEQVEEIVNAKIDAIDYAPYQTKVDETLTTNDKTIVGAINELNAKEDKVGLSKEEVEVVVDGKIVDLQSAEQVEKSINDAVIPIQNAMSTQNNKIHENTYNIEGLQNSLSNYAMLVGGNYFSGQQVFSGNIVVQGSIVQQGMAYETHTQQLYTFNDYIILRDGAITGLTAGEYTGFTARLYDGVNDGRLVFDNTGTARVGDVGFEQPLATRSEATEFYNKHLVMWDANNQKLVDAGEATSTIIEIVSTKSGSIITKTPETPNWYEQLLESNYYANAREGYYLVILQLQVYPNTVPSREYMMFRLAGETGASGDTVPLTQYAATNRTYTTFIWHQETTSKNLGIDIYCPNASMEITINYKVTAIRIKQS